jgi:hypothetical protein
MAQREKRLTKREKKAQTPGGGHQHDHRHIHCIACGRHLDPEEFESSPATAMIIVCQHKSQFPSCTACEAESRARVAEHDRTGQPPQVAGAWH